MPYQHPAWNQVLSCAICLNYFDGEKYQPVSLICCHVFCRNCIGKLRNRQCPFDQTALTVGNPNDLPTNSGLIAILGITYSRTDVIHERIKKQLNSPTDLPLYDAIAEVLNDLACYFEKCAYDRTAYVQSTKLCRPVQRKLIQLICLQSSFVTGEGRLRACRCIRALGERCLTELLVLHQSNFHINSSLWAAVRSRGCQFLGPALQQKVLKLILSKMEHGERICRKILVLDIVHTLQNEHPQASKTSVGHVVQLLYRASCFDIEKRDGESSLMQLKSEFRNIEHLRREHDLQLVTIAQEAGIRISPDQWSTLLYGDQSHRSHIQSIIDQLQTSQTFYQGIQELLLALQRTGDPAQLSSLRHSLEILADIDVSPDADSPAMENLLEEIKALKTVLDAQVLYCTNRCKKRSACIPQRLKITVSRDFAANDQECARGNACIYSHSSPSDHARDRVAVEQVYVAAKPPNADAVQQQLLNGTFGDSTWSQGQPNVHVAPADPSPPVESYPGGAAHLHPMRLVAQVTHLRPDVPSQLQTQPMVGPPGSFNSYYWVPSAQATLQQRTVFGQDVLRVEVPLPSGMQFSPGALQTFNSEPPMYDANPAMLNRENPFIMSPSAFSQPLFAAIPMQQSCVSWPYWPYWQPDKQKRLVQLQKKRQEILKRLDDLSQHDQVNEDEYSISVAMATSLLSDEGNLLHEFSDACDPPAITSPTTRPTYERMYSALGTGNNCHEPSFSLSFEAASVDATVTWSHQGSIVTHSTIESRDFGTSAPSSIGYTIDWRAWQDSHNSNDAIADSSIRHVRNRRWSHDEPQRDDSAASLVPDAPVMSLYSCVSPNSSQSNEAADLDEDQIVPFSGDMPFCSRYGPIQAPVQVAKASTSAQPKSMEALPSNRDMAMTSVIMQPLSAVAVQPMKNIEASREQVDPSCIVGDIPAVFKNQSCEELSVSEKLDRKIKLEDRLVDFTSSVEKEQLRLELNLIDKDISKVGRDAEEEMLKKELETVTLHIEQLELEGEP